MAVRQVRETVIRPTVRRRPAAGRVTTADRGLRRGLCIACGMSMPVWMLLLYALIG